MEIDHVAVKVPALPAALGVLVDGLGFEVVSREIAPDGATAVAFVRMGGVELEVFESSQPGPALAHIGLRVRDLARAARRLEDRGVRSVGDEVPGTRGSRAVLLDPDTTIGVSMHLLVR